MVDAKKNVLITRTPVNAEEFIEYMTSDAGNWSTNETYAYVFSNEEAWRTLCELRHGAEKSDYLYDTVTRPVT